MKTVVVTGGTGFIGRHLVRALNQEGDFLIIIIDNLSNSQLPPSLKKARRKKFGRGSLKFEKIEHGKISFYQADVRDTPTLERIFSQYNEVDLCIHLAAKISVKDSIRIPAETYDVNVRGTKNMLDISAKYGVKNFLLTSSAAVYGNSQNLPLSEREAIRPISPYGKSKKWAEELVSSYSNRIPAVLSLRLFNVYGKGQSSEYAGVITKFADRLHDKLPPIINGSGNQIRDFVSVRDVVRGIFVASAVMDNKNNTGYSGKTTSLKNMIFNIGTGSPTRINDLAAMMIRLLQPSSNLGPIYTNAIAGDILESYADISKIHKLLGFKCNDDLRGGLSSIYR